MTLARPRASSAGLPFSAYPAAAAGHTPRLPGRADHAGKDARPIARARDDIDDGAARLGARKSNDFGGVAADIVTRLVGARGSASALVIAGDTAIFATTATGTASAVAASIIVSPRIALSHGSLR